MYHPSYAINLQLLKKYGKNGKIDIIDYGCGNGILLDLLPAQKVRSYKGYEVSRAALRIAKDVHREKKVVFYELKKGTVPRLGKTSSADLVILIGVLQYLTAAEISRIIRESFRVLRSGGIFLASCVTDHWLYRVLNFYQFFYPNNYINHQTIVEQLQNAGLRVVYHREKGLLIGPLFSHSLVILFDGLDKLFFKNKGKLGPLGIQVRKLFQPLMMWEYRLPFNYGYTLFLVGKK